MRDVRDALAEIHSIRAQMARSTQFRGYGPGATAVSGILGLGVASFQANSNVALGQGFQTCFGIWIITAALCVLLSTVDTVTRARRAHVGYASQMIQSALEQFISALIAGLLLTVILFRTAPDTLWMLPGLWKMLFSLGIFASCRFLPWPLFVVGVWYLVAGLCSLAYCCATRSFSPWAMGVPFGVGQLAVAAVLGFGDTGSTVDS